MISNFICYSLGEANRKTQELSDKFPHLLLVAVNIIALLDGVGSYSVTVIFKDSQ